MFNDEEVTKRDFRYDILCVFCLVIIFVVLILGACFALDILNSQTTETAQPEPIPTVEYEIKNEKDGESNDFVVTEPVFEMNDECNHSWVFSEERGTLIRQAELECVASDGIEKVYLTRYRSAFDSKYDDMYIAYDKNLKDITVQYFDGSIDVRYFIDGMGIPRLEVYETLLVCENCDSVKDVPAEKATIYRFYIPEGTYLISH